MTVLLAAKGQPVSEQQDLQELPVQLVSEALLVPKALLEQLALV
jgi:hypothetical protein